MGDETVKAAIDRLTKLLGATLGGGSGTLISILGTPTVRGIEKEVWVAVRTDSKAGTGTPEDPFDGALGGGNTSFDALMASFSSITDLTIHLLGTGPFTKDTAATWLVQPGWTIIGSGRDVTVCQLTGAKTIASDVEFFKSDSNVDTDDVTIRDLTIDGNYSALTGSVNAGFKSGGVIIFGSNNLVENVLTENFYGNVAEGTEHFDIALGAGNIGTVSGNLIRNCVGQSPAGDYGSPFALLGNGSNLVTNSGVEHCQAYGVNNGANSGFTSGGVNLASFRDCWVTNNHFVDCFSIAYFDTGTADGLSATNNSAVRAEMVFGLQHTATNIKILNNRATIQKRDPDLGASYGILNNGGSGTTGLVISGNTFTVVSGGGGDVVRPISLTNLTTATIVNNQVDDPDTLCTATGSGVFRMFNRTPAGVVITALSDTALPVASGGTGATTASAARTALEVGHKVTAPANASSTGTTGDWAQDTGFIYICTTTDTWKRVAIATWP